MAATLRAVNTDPESENRMHSDEAAREYGFDRGLVPGVDIFGYLAAEALREMPDWMESGGGELRLLKPYYDGEEVHLRSERHEGVPTIYADDRAWLRLGAPDLQADPPSAPVRHPRPPASEQSLAAGAVLGSLRCNFEAVSPRDALDLANRILMQHVTLDPWIHTGSRMQWNGLGSAKRVEVRGMVRELFERKGRGFVTLALAYWDLDRAARVGIVEHTAIWRMRR